MLALQKDNLRQVKEYQRHPLDQSHHHLALVALPAFAAAAFPFQSHASHFVFSSPARLV